MAIKDLKYWEERGNKTWNRLERARSLVTKWEYELDRCDEKIAELQAKEPQNAGK